MDNTITGLFGVLLFGVFIVGLAESIDALPFTLIVVVVCALAGYDFYESVRDARKAAQNGSTDQA